MTYNWQRYILTRCLALALLAAAMSMQTGLATASCFEFFSSLGDTTGHCAEVSLFSNSADISGSVDGELTAAINIVDLPGDLPNALKPSLEPVFANVQLNISGSPGDIRSLNIAHRGQIGMFPIADNPLPTDPFVFLDASSESQVVFKAIDPDGDNVARLSIELEQNFFVSDPLANSSPGEVGTFFLLELEEIAQQTRLFDISGASSYDADSDVQPKFSDPFAPGYDGFATATSLGEGQLTVDFERTFELDIVEETSIALTTLQNLFIIGEPSVTESDPLRVDSSDTFVFRISSPDPDVRFEVVGLAEEAGLGDHNQDGAVNAADFFTWQQGNSPNPLSAADLLAWKTHYGRSSSVGSMTSGVPEPNSLVLATLFIVVGVFRSTEAGRANASSEKN